MRPDGLHDLVFRDQLPTAASQQAKQSECAPAERYRGSNAGLVKTRQTIAIEAKAFEEQSVGPRKHLRALFLRRIRREPAQANLALTGAQSQRGEARRGPKL